MPHYETPRHQSEFAPLKLRVGHVPLFSKFAVSATPRALLSNSPEMPRKRHCSSLRSLEGRIREELEVHAPPLLLTGALWNELAPLPSARLLIVSCQTP